MSLEGRRLRESFSLKKVKKILSSWHIYGLSLLYGLESTSKLVQTIFADFLHSTLGGTNGTPIYAQYLKLHKKLKYNFTQINNSPSFTSTVQITSALIYAWISDSILGGRR
jgi:ACS family pantothenate transporter-like MFS transporter